MVRHGPLGWILLGLACGGAALDIVGGRPTTLYPAVSCETLRLRGPTCSCDDVADGLHVVVDGAVDGDSLACTDPLCGSGSKHMYRKSGVGLVLGIVERASLRTLLSRLTHVTFTASLDVTVSSVARTAYWTPNLYFYNRKTTHYYQIFHPTSDFVSWEAAQTFCASETRALFGLVGYLATVTTPDEMRFVRNIMDTARPVWLGATDNSTMGVWRWVTGPDSGCAPYSACPVGPGGDCRDPVTCRTGLVFYNASSAPPGVGYHDFAPDDLDSTRPDKAYLAAYAAPSDGWGALNGWAEDPSAQARPIPLCEWGGVGYDCLAGTLTPITLTRVVNECTDRCTSCANGACESANQTCIDGAELYDWTCVCPPPSLTSSVTAVASCKVDECIAKCRTCMRKGDTCGMYATCVDPNTSPQSLGDWTCVPLAVRGFTQGAFFPLFESFGCGNLTFRDSGLRKAPGQVAPTRCGCDTVKTTEVSVTVTGYAAGVDAIQCEGCSMQEYRLDVEVFEALRAVKLTVRERFGGYAMPLAYFMPAITRLRFRAGAEGGSPRVATLNLMAAQYIPQTQRFYRAFRFDTARFADTLAVQAEVCGAPEHDLAEAPGYLASMLPQVGVLDHVSLRAALVPGVRYLTGAVGSVDAAGAERVLWVTGASGCPPYPADPDLSKPYAHAHRALCRSPADADCAHWALGCGEGQPQRPDLGGWASPAPHWPPRSGGTVVLNVSRDASGGPTPALAGAQSPSAIGGALCEWGGVGSTCIVASTLHVPIVLERSDAVDCEVVTNAAVCAAEGQICVDPNSFVSGDWECHCVGDGVGMSVRGAALCRLDECAAECETCENGACGVGQTCMDPDQRVRARGNWVCSCALPGVGERVGGAATCREPEVITYRAQASPSGATGSGPSVQLFPYLTCELDFSFGRPLGEVIAPIDRECNTPVAEAALHIARGYVPGDALHCGICARLSIAPTFTVIGNHTAFLSLTWIPRAVPLSLRAMAAAIRNVTFTPSADVDVHEDRLIIYSMGPGLAFPGLSHTYRLVEVTPATTWDAAGIVCTASLRDDMPMASMGYPATVASAVENSVVRTVYEAWQADLAAQQRTAGGLMWLGATSHGDGGGTYRWKAGPEGCPRYTAADPPVCRDNAAYVGLCRGDSCKSGEPAAWTNFTTPPTTDDAIEGRIFLAVDGSGGWHTVARDAAAAGVAGVLCEFGGGESYIGEADMRAAVRVTAVLDECTVECPTCARDVCTSAGLICIDPNPTSGATGDWECICPFPGPAAVAAGLRGCALDECVVVAACSTADPASRDRACEAQPDARMNALGVAGSWQGAPVGVDLGKCAAVCQAMANGACEAREERMCVDPSPTMADRKDWLCVCKDSGRLEPYCRGVATGEPSPGEGPQDDSDGGNTTRTEGGPDTSPAAQIFPERTASMAGYVAGATVMIGGNAVPCLWHAAVATTCQDGPTRAPVVYARVLHPTQLSLAGDAAAGMVVGNLCIVAACAAIAMVVSSRCRRGADRDPAWVAVLDNMGVARHPTLPLLAFQATAQGILAGSMNALWSPATIQDYFAVLAGTAATCLFTFKVFVITHSEAPHHAVYSRDGRGANFSVVSLKAAADAQQPTAGAWAARFAAGDSEWINRNPESRWVEAHASVVRGYVPYRGWYWILEIGACVAVAVLMAVRQHNALSCGQTAVATAVLFFLLFVAEILACPRARPRDWATLLCFTLLESGGASAYAVGYLNADPASTGFTVGRYCLQAVELLLVAKLIIDVVALAFVTLTFRRQRLQRAHADAREMPGRDDAGETSAGISDPLSRDPKSDVGRSMDAYVAFVDPEAEDSTTSHGSARAGDAADSSLTTASNGHAGGSMQRSAGELLMPAPQPRGVRAHPPLPSLTGRTPPLTAQLSADDSTTPRLRAARGPRSDNTTLRPPPISLPGSPTGTEVTHQRSNESFEATVPLSGIFAKSGTSAPHLALLTPPRVGLDSVKPQPLLGSSAPARKLLGPTSTRGPLVSAAVASPRSRGRLAGPSSPTLPAPAAAAGASVGFQGSTQSASGTGSTLDVATPRARDEDTLTGLGLADSFGLNGLLQRVGSVADTAPTTRDAVPQQSSSDAATPTGAYRAKHKGRALLFGAASSGGSGLLHHLTVTAPDAQRAGPSPMLAGSPRHRPQHATPPPRGVSFVLAPEHGSNPLLSLPSQGDASLGALIGSRGGDDLNSPRAGGAVQKVALQRMRSVDCHDFSPLSVPAQRPTI